MAETYPDPTPEMLAKDPRFNAIWEAIKGWEIQREPGAGYAGATGNDARHIYDAIQEKPMADQEPQTLGEAITDATTKQVAQVFEQWERTYRNTPENFLTPEECRAMEIGTLAEQSAIYFMALARKLGFV